MYCLLLGEDWHEICIAASKDEFEVEGDEIQACDSVPEVK